MVKKGRAVLLIAALLFCLVLAGLFWRRRHGAEQGVAIRPEREHPAGMVQAYSQRDEQWAEDKLGGSVYRMRGSGCLTSCIASALSTQAVRMGAGGEADANGSRGAGESVDAGGSGGADESVDASGSGGVDESAGMRVISAGGLNRIFSESQVYNDQGDIVWGRIEEVMPDVGVLVASSVDGEQIEALLEEGRYPIVKVEVGGNGAAHWVLLVGSDGGEYLCMDPLVEDGELVPLSRHGGVVYRMRCVYWEG